MTWSSRGGATTTSPRWRTRARLFDDAEPELVFHLAAEVGGIGANRANPGRYWYANLVMGAHVLEQARLHATPKLVIAGTVCAYPKLTPVPFREDDLWNGYPEETNAPYGVAKKAVLVGAQAYREQYGTNAIFLLPTNLYGPRDNFDLETSHVIPALIRKMLESRDEIVLWGDGSPTREYLFVDDCVDGLMLGAERYDGPDPVNLGTGVETTIRETAELVAEAVGFDGRIVWDTSMPNGQPRRSLDATRAEQLFGFRRACRCARGSRAPSSGIAAEHDDRERRSRARAAAGRRRARPHHGRESSPTSLVALACIVVAQIALTVRPLLLGRAQRLAHLPGWRSDLACTTGWLLGQAARCRTRSSATAGRSLAGTVDVGQRRGLRSSMLPRHDRSDVLVLGPIALLAVFDIGAADRRPRRRPLVRAFFGSLAPFLVDPALRGSLPGTLGRPVPRAGAGAHAARGLPVHSARGRRRRPSCSARSMRGVLSQGGAGGPAVAGWAIGAETRERALPRGGVLLAYVLAWRWRKCACVRRRRSRRHCSARDLEGARHSVRYRLFVTRSRPRGSVGAGPSPLAAVALER